MEYPEACGAQTIHRLRRPGDWYHLPDSAHSAVLQNSHSFHPRTIHDPHPLPFLPDGDARCGQFVLDLRNCVFTGVDHPGNDRGIGLALAKRLRQMAGIPGPA